MAFKVVRKIEFKLSSVFRKNGKLFKKQVCVIFHGNLLQVDISDKVIFQVPEYNGAFSPGMNW